MSRPNPFLLLQQEVAKAYNEKNRCEALVTSLEITQQHISEQLELARGISSIVDSRLRELLVRQGEAYNNVPDSEEDEEEEPKPKRRKVSGKRRSVMPTLLRLLVDSGSDGILGRSLVEKAETITSHLTYLRDHGYANRSESELGDRYFPTDKARAKVAKV